MFSGELVLIILMLLTVKHFIADFLLQLPYQYLNKGTYGHPGGILHAAIHIVWSFGVIAPILLTQDQMLLWLWLCIAEGVAHYHIDWAKMKLNKYYGWACNTTDKFWYLVGFDQLLHFLTYLVMVAVLLTSG